MSLITKRRKYKCWNDCVPQGCPGHTASIKYQSVSESLALYDGDGHVLYIQTPELEAFMEMLRELAEARVEIKTSLSPHPKKEEEVGEE